MTKKRSHISITVETDFKTRTEDQDDITDYLESIFHDAVYKCVEEFFSGHDFEQTIMDEMVTNYKSLPDDIKEFSDLGGILLSYSHGDVKEVVKQLKIEDVQ